MVSSVAPSGEPRDEDRHQFAPQPGQFDGTAVAVEQLDAELFFQRPDLHGERGLRQVGRRGRAREAERASDGEVGPDLTQRNIRQRYRKTIAQTVSFAHSPT
jgi:hypothetical protein